MSFVKKMIELRKQNGLSQQDLADRLGVSRQAISRWETGAVQPLADSVKSLAQVFQVSTDYLLNDDLDTPTLPSAYADTPGRTHAHPETPEMAPGSGGPGCCRCADPGHGSGHGVLPPMEGETAGVHVRRKHRYR